MPRPTHPTTIRLRPFRRVGLDDAAARSIADALAPAPFTPELRGAIEDLIGLYRQTAGGSRATTLANVLHTLTQLNGTARARREALEVLSHPSSGIDYGTHRLTHALASATLAGDENAAGDLATVAAQRAAELLVHERINSETEPLYGFGAHVHAVWFHASGKGLEQCDDADAARCLRFALRVFQAAGAGADSLVDHPARLRAYLLADFP
jgi:hypothetical protein